MRNQPPRKPTVKDRHITFRCNDNTMHALSNLCNANQIHPSDMLRKLITEAWQAHADGLLLDKKPKNRKERHEP